MKSLFTRHGVLRLLVLSVALGALGVSAGAFAAGEGGLRVTVTTPDGAPIEGARVSASSPTSLVKRSGVSTNDGTVILHGLPPGQDYTITVVAEGYRDFTSHNVAVISNQQLDQHYVLSSAVQALGAIQVTGQSLAAIDTTSTSTGAVLTLDITQSIPTGRSYQDYLELVPAVKPSSTGNPASRSGVNFSQIGGDFGQSTDNIYILDGVNVTDPESGTFGSNINSEVIRQQVVLTGGIPAKYPGGVGLVTEVITKSGGNEFHGSASYYFQNSSLVSDYKHESHSDFSRWTAAFTLGGPIVKDKLWFFLSYQKSNDSVDVLNPETQDLMRTAETDSDFSFAKLTYQITEDDRFQVSFFNDPEDIGSLNDPTVPNQQDIVRHQGGNNYRLEYNHHWANFDLTAYYYKHELELKGTPKDESVSNTVAYLGSIPGVVSSDINRGGYGYQYDIWHNSDEYGINGETWIYTDWGNHDIEFGALIKNNIYQNESGYTHGAWFGSISQSTVAALGGAVTLGDVLDAQNAGLFTGAAPLDPNPFELFDTYGFADDYPDVVDWLDTNGDGKVSKAEFLATPIGSTQGNPNGAVNVRRQLVLPQPYELKSKGQVAYLQDSWTIGQWTTNVGVRAEKWSHYTSTGEKFYTFDWTFAPRVSVSYDLFGDGTAKVWGFYGRYYDPIRNNMTDFAGAVTANVVKSQVWIANPTTSDPNDGKWVTYRQRGGVGHRDANFVPNTKTPYTDELLLGFAKTLSTNTALEVVADYRKTKNILEDFNLGLYTSKSAGFLRLPYSYFGYPESGPPEGINYFIGTLKGGEREYYGLTATLTKYRADNWMGQISYTYNHAEGNTNSDSNADFQGDLLILDPRAPNRYGPQPGNIKHMFQAYGAYYFENDLELGAVFNWYSGIVYSKTFSAAGRHLPLLGDARPINGITNTWIAPGVVGGYTGPSFWTLDLRLKYNWDLPTGTLHFFVDIFNVLNRQQPRMVQDLAAGSATYAFGEPNAWTEPRQLYLGVRYNF